MGPYYDENGRPWPSEKEPPSTDETDSEEEKESTREKEPALHIFQTNDSGPRYEENSVNMCKVFRSPRKAAMGRYDVGMTVVGEKGIGQRELRVKLEGPCDGREEPAEYIVGTCDADAHQYTIYRSDNDLPLGPPPLCNPEPPHDYLPGQGHTLSFSLFSMTRSLPQVIVLAYDATNRQTFEDLKQNYDETIKRIAHARTVWFANGYRNWPYGEVGPLHIIIAGFSEWKHGDTRDTGGWERRKVLTSEVMEFARLKNEQHKKEREERWMDIEIEFVKEMQRDAGLEKQWAVAKKGKEASENYWEKRREERRRKNHNKRCRWYWTEKLGGKWGNEKVEKEKKEENKQFWVDHMKMKEDGDREREEERRKEKEKYKKLKEEHLKRREEGKMEEHDILPTDPEYKIPISSLPLLVKGTELDVDDWDAVDKFMKDIVLDVHASWTAVRFPLQTERLRRRREWEEGEKRKEKEAKTLKGRVKSLVERVEKSFGRGDGEGKGDGEDTL